MYVHRLKNESAVLFSLISAPPCNTIAPPLHHLRKKGRSVLILPRSTDYLIRETLFVFQTLCTPEIMSLVAPKPTRMHSLKTVTATLRITIGWIFRHKSLENNVMCCSINYNISSISKGQLFKLYDFFLSCHEILYKYC